MYFRYNKFTVVLAAALQLCPQAGMLDAQGLTAGGRAGGHSGPKSLFVEPRV